MSNEAVTHYQTQPRDENVTPGTCLITVSVQQWRMLSKDPGYPVLTSRSMYNSSKKTVLQFLLQFWYNLQREPSKWYVCLFGGVASGILLFLFFFFFFFLFGRGRGSKPHNTSRKVQKLVLFPKDQTPERK